jgi:hypothetical protein
MVAEIVPPTALVWIANVALADPAGTVTLAGTVTGSPPDKDTTAPPSGAAPVSVTVPVTEVPPATVEVLSTIEESPTREMTVSADDWRLLVSDAMMVAVPGPTAATVNAALDEPAWAVTGV